MTKREPVNILLVDDQPTRLLTYRAILDELGENLIAAGSAREAFDHLLRNDIAIVLIDVIMPELDGFELATMIRNHPRFEQAAIIFVSGLALADVDLLRGYEHGAVDYLTVPVVPELLRAKVRVFAELYRKTRELETLNAELEQRVEERTAELAQANAMLEQRVEERTREREMALAQVHEMQKLESLGQLTGGVAHDFNNVLMSIMGNLDLLLGNPDRLMAKRLIDGAMRAAQRGANLAARMLAFARRQELQPEAVDIAARIDGLSDMLQRSLGPMIEISFDFAAGLPLIMVDPNQFELALLNLALNARDAMPNGGRLTIAARSQTVGGPVAATLAAGDYVCVSVGDTGIGMDEATLKRAAEPFFTTKAPDKGTGLGLSTVYGLAAQSGGMARIFSEVGRGTTAEVWFPSAGPGTADQPAPAPRAVEERRRSRAILLVDDNPLVAESTSFMLDHLGHCVTVASSGAEALALLEAHRDIDLVITDNAMPGMSGIDLAERIREAYPRLPVVLATGYAELSAGKGKDLGLPRLNKPYRLQELSSLLSKLFDDEVGARQHSVGSAASG